ncbi:hypothetical protein NCS52_01251100 [Fusarium sp. LHS14.1]|nr:hypothetical protein NCS52_01251100 [Fusarium sp. LHS14.1]
MASHGEMRDSAAHPLQPSEERLSPTQVNSNTLSSFEAADAAFQGIFPDDGVSRAIGRQEDPSLEDVQVDHSGCQLNSEQLLKKRVRDCLHFLIIGLATQLNHCGETAESKHHHMASIRLTGFTDQVNEQSPLSFDLYISSRIDWTPYRWLQSQCIIQESVQQVEEPGCDLIQDYEEAKQRLCFLLEEGQGGRLLRQRDAAMCHASIDTPTVSLVQLFNNGSLNHHRFIPRDDPNYFLPRDRVNLCLKLALSLLQLLREEWRHIEWSPENIFFLKDPILGVVKDKTRPYLSWTANTTSSGERVATNTNDPTCDPHLLHFARLLIEIEAGKRIKTTARGLELQKKLQREIRKNSYSPQDSMFVAAVNSCLSNKREGGPDEFRDFIFRDIVVNLERFAASHDRPDELSRSSTSSEQSASSDGSRALVSRYDDKSSNAPVNVEFSKAAKTFCRDMEAWRFRNIEPLREKHPPATNLYSQQKVKIAVIDSGASKTDFGILGAWRKGVIKGGRNFLPGAAPDDWNDVNGHGTIVTSLLLDHAPNSEIYVAKITDEDKIDSKGLFGVSQAINWAIQKWQVDIISMSLVLDRVHEGIEEQLAQAIDPSYEGPGISRKIVFAAAGNHGGNRRIGWPASRKGVIAIHASDGLGTPTNINPTPDRTDDNFATLGRDIEIEVALKNGEYEKKYVTGTSFATPIAAAIAANVLEFSRHKLHLTLDRKRTLYTGPCIRRIFKKMAERRGDYDYLQPWTLWEHQDGICQVLLDAIAE